jgi:hypothetical protein
VTRFVESQPTTNQTTNITAARNLHIHSLAISTTGVTNTIALPTTNSFDGDVALVVHQGPTSSVTAVRTAGAGTNLITLNQFEEAVEFVYYNSVWQFNHNLSYIEPIFFSGTNAAANAAASRTNLGTWLAAALTNTMFICVKLMGLAAHIVHLLGITIKMLRTNGIDFALCRAAHQNKSGIGSGANYCSFGKIRVPTGELPRTSQASASLYSQQTRRHRSGGRYGIFSSTELYGPQTWQTQRST